MRDAHDAIDRSDHGAASAAAGPTGRLTRRELFLYSLPMAGFMAASLPLSIYLPKYATDTLGLPAAAMGFALMAARLWDGVSDPAAGYLSDRTRSAYGRRRSWMRASAIPLCITLYAIWVPPVSLDPAMMIAWFALAYILWETASTLLLVPYGALGNELTTDHHERTRLFGWRHAISALGYPVALGLVYLIRTSAEAGDAAGRETVAIVAVCAGLLVAGPAWFAASALREPPRHQGRGGERVFDAFGDVFRNPHARILLTVYAIEAFGMGSLTILTPFVVHNVLGNSNLLEPVLLCWVIPQFLFTPLWVWCSRRVGKKRLWIAGMSVYASGFASILLLEPGRVWLIVAAVIVLGIGGGIANIVAPSVQADVIDYDESVSGQRKEGAYTAVWNLIRKSGYALAAGFTGLALQASGYDGATQEQSPQVMQTILWLSGGVPATAYLLGALLLSRFSLTEDVHDRLRAQIEAPR